jgi:hypothetical protein
MSYVDNNWYLPEKKFNTCEMLVHTGIPQRDLARRCLLCGGRPGIGKQHHHIQEAALEKCVSGRYGQLEHLGSTVKSIPHLLVIHLCHGTLTQQDLGKNLNGR